MSSGIRLVRGIGCATNRRLAPCRSRLRPDEFQMRCNQLLLNLIILRRQLRGNAEFAPKTITWITVTYPTNFQRLSFHQLFSSKRLYRLFFKRRRALVKRRKVSSFFGIKQNRLPITYISAKPPSLPTSTTRPDPWSLRSQFGEHSPRPRLALL